METKFTLEEGLYLVRKKFSTFKPVNFFDFSAGILGYTDKFYMGFVAHHLLEPDESLRTNSLSETRLPMRYTIHLGTEFDLASHSLYTY